MLNPTKTFVPGKGLSEEPLAASMQSPVSSPTREREKAGVNPTTPIASASDISPSMAKFLDKDTQKLPYWSPATHIASSSSNVGNTDILAQSGMNISASEWVPPEADDDPRSFGEEGAMVEIVLNGSNLFVPESLLYEYLDAGADVVTDDENAVTSIDDGLKWAIDSTTLLAPPRRTLQTIGIPEPIRQHFQGLDLDSLREMDPSDERYKELPQRFHSAYPLDKQDAQSGLGGSFGYPSYLFKVVDRSDSQIYALRRIENVRSNPSVIKHALDLWQNIRHPSIVSLYSIYQEKGAIFFSHAYHPTARTLREYFLELNQRSGNSLSPLAESDVWSIFAQLLSGLRRVHARGLAVRAVDINHVLITSGTRFRFNCVGVSDVIEFESRKTVQDLQVEDMVKFGFLLLSVANRTPVGPKSLDYGLANLRKSYSPELIAVVEALLSGKATAASISKQASIHICDELDLAMASSDSLHGHLRNEYENGRLFKLLLKLGFINERPEYSPGSKHSPSASSNAWSETGDRYIIKLFRDYVFHQVKPNGAPVLDAGHVVSSLNKLDCGDTEQILLSSRFNKKDLLVVSFSDVRRCIEEAFLDLAQQADPQAAAALAAMAGDQQMAYDMAMGIAGQDSFYPSGPLGYRVNNHQSASTNPSSSYSGYPPSQQMHRGGAYSGHANSQHQYHHGSQPSTNRPSHRDNASASSSSAGGGRGGRGSNQMNNGNNRGGKRAVIGGGVNGTAIGSTIIGGGMRSAAGSVPSTHQQPGFVPGYAYDTTAGSGLGAGRGSGGYYDSGMMMAGGAVGGSLYQTSEQHHLPQQRTDGSKGMSGVGGAGNAFNSGGNDAQGYYPGAQHFVGNNMMQMKESQSFRPSHDGFRQPSLPPPQHGISASNPVVGFPSGLQGSEGYLPSYAPMGGHSYPYEQQQRQQHQQQQSAQNFGPTRKY